MKKRFLTILTAIFALVLGLAVLAACGGDKTEGEGGSDGISINLSTVSLSVGDEQNLRVTSKSRTFTWTSSNEAVVGFVGATNKSSARIKGVGKGEATVTATDGDGKSVSCAVTVDEFTVVISGADGGKVTILRKDDGSYESKSLTAKVLRSGQETNEAVTWGSSDNAVVTVENGVLTAHKIGTATVTAKRSSGSAKASVEVEVKWENTPAGYYTMQSSGSAGANANRGTWTWAGFQGDGGTPTLDGEGMGTDGDVSFTVADNTGWRWYAVQIFYKNPNLEAGFYQLTFTLTSSVDANITVNETPVALTKGENTVTVYYYDGGSGSENMSISMNLATHDKYRNALVPDGFDDGESKVLQAGTVSIKNLHWTSYDPSAAGNKLAAPTAFSVNASTKEITVTDSNPNEKLEGYVIGFFEAGKEAPTYTTVVMKPVEGRNILTDRGGVSYYPDEQGNVAANAGKMFLDDSAVAAGQYTLKVKAYSGVAQYGESDWFTASETYTKTGEVSYDVLPSYRDVDRGIGRYYGWSEWGQIDFSKSSFKGNTLTVALTGEASWYSNQLYYEPKPGEFLQDHLYELTFTLSAKDGDGNDVDLTNKQFIVAGQRVDTTTGTHEYTVRFYYLGGNFTMLFGKPSPDWQSDSEDNGDLAAGVYTFSNMQFKDLGDPDTNPAMFFGTDANLADNPDRFIYWYAASSDLTYSADLGGTMAGGATMRSMSATANPESVTGYSHSFDYKVDPIEGKNCVWIVRFWYKNTKLEGGKEYHVVLSITSDEEGDILVNGSKLHITTGTHEYSVYYEGADFSLLSINMATETTMMGADADGIKVTFNSIKWVEGGIQRLTAPTGSISAEGVVTFTDPNGGTGVDHFELGLFEGDTLVSTQNIANNGSIEAGKHQNGAYTVKIRACGISGYRDSDWAALGSFTVTNGYDLDSRLEQDTDHAANHPGQWYHWLDHWDWEGSTATATKSEIDMENKTFTFGFTTEGTPRLGYGVQLYFKNAGNVAGTLYTFTADLKLSVDGTITVNGEQVELKAGETKHVSIRYSETNLSISIQTGVYQGTPVMNGEITISNWAWEEVTGNPNGETYDVVYTTKEEPQIPADSTFYYWSEDFGGGMQMTNVKYDHGTVSFDLAGGGNWYSNQIFYRGIGIPQADEAYTFTMKIHSTVAGNVRINGKIVTLTVGDNDITVEKSNGMFSIQMGEPNSEWQGNLSTIANGSFTLSDFLWTAADGTQYNLDGKVNK